MAETTESESQCPEAIDSFANKAVEYVDRALGLVMEFDSDTLPVLDHYLRTIEAQEQAVVALIAATAGAYFGEVVRRHIGGTWVMRNDDPAQWRLRLLTGISFSPVGVVAAAIMQRETEEFESGLEVPARLEPYVDDALSRMGAVTEENFFSLCGRLDTLEHLHDVLLAVAATLSADSADSTDRN